MIRVIAGRWRGRLLATPPGLATRPTAQRSREALFSMLASRLGSFEGLRVIDLFAGSGALGIEALSRGSAHCLFVEQDRTAVAAIRDNLARLGAAGDVRQQAVAALGPGTAVDLMLMDPPYGSGEAGPALRRLATTGWAEPGCWAGVETAAGEAVAVDGWEAAAERVHGRARLTLLRLI